MYSNYIPFNLNRLLNFIIYCTPQRQSLHDTQTLIAPIASFYAPQFVKGVQH